LGKLLERIIEKPLSLAAREWIFDPLGMKNTLFVPSDKDNCAATGISDSGRLLRGETRDMFVFSQMLLNRGYFQGKRVLGEITVDNMIGDITNSGVFEIPTSYLHYILSGPKIWFWEYAFSRYSFFGDLVSKKAIGKMGGAGTFLFIDPKYNIVIVYLTNYGQPLPTLEGEKGWNKFLEDIDIMGLCNIVLGNLSNIK